MRYSEQNWGCTFFICWLIWEGCLGICYLKYVWSIQWKYILQIRKWTDQPKTGLIVINNAISHVIKSVLTECPCCVTPGFHWDSAQDFLSSSSDYLMLFLSNWQLVSSTIIENKSPQRNISEGSECFSLMFKTCLRHSHSCLRHCSFLTALIRTVTLGVCEALQRNTVTQRLRMRSGLFLAVPAVTKQKNSREISPSDPSDPDPRDIKHLWPYH